MTTLMVNRLNQAGPEVIVSTRLYASSPLAGKWYEAVDDGIDECNGLGTGSRSH
jgi:hypothetical protein